MRRRGGEEILTAEHRDIWAEDGFAGDLEDAGAGGDWGGGYEAGAAVGEVGGGDRVDGDAAGEGVGFEVGVLWCNMRVSV